MNDKPNPSVDGVAALLQWCISREVSRFENPRPIRVIERKGQSCSRIWSVEALSPEGEWEDCVPGGSDVRATTDGSMKHGW